MKKLIVGLACVTSVSLGVIIAGCIGFANDFKAYKEDIKQEHKAMVQQEKMKSNQSIAGEKVTTYSYEVTEVSNGEVFGKAINSQKADDNAGIYLMQDDFDFNVKGGDIITVMFGSDGEIMDVERAK